MSDWDGRTVLVTGAAGLLGGWVCRALVREGATVRGFDIDWEHGVLLTEDEPVVRLDGDVRRREDVEDALSGGVDTVIHLAAQAIVGPANDDPITTFEHNISGTWVTLEACRGASVVTSVVVASSDKAYGDHGGEPYVETAPLLARHPYDASKACADILAQVYAQSFGLPVTVTRCGNMYGPGDVEWSRIVPGTVRSVLRSERPVIRSDGRYVRDYLFVGDCAEGVLTLAAATRERGELGGEAFNFSAGVRLSVLEILERILNLAGSDLVPDIRDEAVNEIPEQRVDSTKARTLLGWTPGRSLDEGLTASIDWYRGYLEAAG